MKHLGKVLSWIFIIILGFIAGLVVWLLIQTKIYPDKIPSIFGYKPFIVIDSSMRDVIENGDLIIVKNIDPKKLKKNDIIAFRDAENYVVTNRIAEVVKRDGKLVFVTMGDDLGESYSELVDDSDVEGIYDFKISGAGSIVLIMQRPSTLIFVLLVIFVGGALYIFFSNEATIVIQKKSNR